MSRAYGVRRRRVPSTHVSGLNPAIERAILRCVDPDPAKRPASAATLAASLPGGDPLAMAIAAGETPSPEMVAGAGGEGRLSPSMAAACLLALLVGLAGVWYVADKATLPNLVPLPKPPSELALTARAVLHSVGYDSPAVGEAHGFEWTASTSGRSNGKINQRADGATCRR